MKKELEELRRRVEVCRRCRLWKTRKKPVFGEGAEQAEIMIVGLGPGYHENVAGRPFVGAAGTLLDTLLELAGLQREDVYITNVMKCYLPANKATKEEITACTPYLKRQIELMAPLIILPLGNIATHYFFEKTEQRGAPMRTLHGRAFTASPLVRAKVIPMYHPAAALRNPRLREVIQNDWINLATKLAY